MRCHGLSRPLNPEPPSAGSTDPGTGWVCGDRRVLVGVAALIIPIDVTSQSVS